MDFVIRLINKDKKVTGLAADHFGYEDKMFKACHILISLLKGDSVPIEDFKFIKDHFYQVNLRLTKAPDIIIDDVKHKLTNCLGFVLKPVKQEEEQINKALPSVSFEKEDLLINETMSYEDFEILYQFLLENFKKHKILLNDKYTLEFETSPDKY